MSDKQFISNLSSTYADVRKLDVKKINLKGKNILEYISENKTNVLDERGINADDELDIWNSYITKDEEGNVIVDMTPTPKEHTLGSITNNQKSTLYRVAKIINNEVLDANGNHLMYWQTDGLTDASDFRNDGRPLLGTIINFESDLSSLTNGDSMFQECSNLTTFNADLSSLTDGDSMFNNCSSLRTFTSDLSSLTNGILMFHSCDNLNTFASDLSSLTIGMNMFHSCDNLTTFSSDLSSLTNGSGMYHRCKLDAKSVANIITFLPTNESQGTITIGIGITNTDEAKQAFAEECYCDSWEELKQDFTDKNWGVEWQFNGPASYSLRDPRPSTAVFAKLVEVIMPTDVKNHKPHYAYTSQDGTKFYNIHWYHDSNTNNEGYDYFESLEEAIGAYGVIPKQ